MENFLAMANTQLDSENYGLAINYIDSARMINPNSAESYFIEAHIYEKEGLIRYSIEAYDKGLNLNPSYVEGYIRRARLRYEVKDHRDYSLSDIDAAIRVDPGNAFLYKEKAFYLSNTLNPVTREPDYEEAIQNLNKAIALDHKNDTYYTLRGQYKFTAGERLGALQDLSLAIELAPENDSHYHDRGITYLAIENFREAESDFSKAIDLSPDNEGHYLKRGHSRFNQFRYERAIDDFTLSIDIIFNKIMETEGKISMEHPLNLALRDTYIFRGSAFIFTENNFEACQDFERAQELGSSKATNYIRRYCRF